MKLTPIASNMTEINVGDLTVLFSYQTPVAAHIAGEGFFRTSKKWSVTTSRHINKWVARHGGSGKVEERPQEYFDGLLRVGAE